MNRKPLVWKLFPVYFVITAVSVLMVGLLALEAMREFYYRQTEDDLVVRAQLVREQMIAEGLTTAPQSKLNSAIHKIAPSAGVRITYVLPSGEVAADSEHDPATMENHADRPEFREAVRSGSGASRRPSPTLGTTMVYVAVPVRVKDRLVGVIRVAENASAVDARPAAASSRVALAVLLVAALAAVVSFVAARRIAGPIRQLQTAADNLATGNLASRAPVPDTLELAGLADALNRMAGQLEDQVRHIERQSREQGAILSSMGEGVVAISDNDQVIIVNPAAERMLGISTAQVSGRTVQEAIRYPALQRFVASLREGRRLEEDDSLLHMPGNRIIQMAGTDLHDGDGKPIGLLIVLNDVTQARRLDEMRSDFVANVSHELRTPITAIKGFVETLKQGAVNDAQKSEEFLDIVARQADRLNSIISDLLTLSEIERKEDTAQIPMEQQSICPVIEAAVSNIQHRASEARVTIRLECADGLSSAVNAPLLEQAVTNLLDNAVKYSPEDSVVTVRADQSDEELVISISDSGPGIDPEHLPRLFERFYRVDKARSRKLGGTGLGLAIVKHIAQAHKGTAEVESTPGKGSTFTIRLPQS